MKHILPQLPYAYDALEPHIDTQTMEIHHTKHHQGYVDKLNGVLEKYPDISERKLEEIMLSLPTLAMAEGDKAMLKNNGGGHLNHSLFWQIMGSQKEIDQTLLDNIAKTFGTLAEFKKLFTQTAVGHFGSGWAWLSRDGDGKLQVYSLPNQDSPYLKGHAPIIGLDVWEHAYYLKYQNRRAEYVDSWWNALKLI